MMKIKHTAKSLNIPPERQTKISFDPVPHKYYDDNGIVYTSVTTLIGRYENPFNHKYWSMYVALRDSGYKVRPDGKKCKTIYVDGIPRSLDSLYTNPINSYLVTSVTAKWKKLTEIACARGNEIHDGLEADINKSKGDDEGKTNSFIIPNRSLSDEVLKMRTKHDLDVTGLEERYPSIYKVLLRYINQGCILYAEKRIYSTAYQIAGMIDVLIVKGKQFMILDWKTNKAIMMFESGYFKKEKIGNEYVKTDKFITTNDTLKYPLNNIADCKGMKYTLQLSLYARIMVAWGYTLVPNGLVICHIRPDMKPKFIPCRYLGKEIDLMLIDHYMKNVAPIQEPKSKINNIFGIN